MDPLVVSILQLLGSVSILGRQFSGLMFLELLRMTAKDLVENAMNYVLIIPIVNMS